MTKAFTIQHTRVYPGGTPVPDSLTHYGTFTTRRDAERWLEDNPDTPNATIQPTAANMTCDWGADCPKCKTRAVRAWDKGYTGTIELWWRCPNCNHEFTR